MDTIQTPSIAYGALSPMLIMLGAAIVGVLVEALLPRPARRPAQLAVLLIGLIAALVAICAYALNGDPVVTAGGAVAIDGVALFLQGTIVVLGVVCVLLLGEGRLEPGGVIVAEAGVVAGSGADRVQAESRHTQTEIFPLAAFALAGMMLFAASNDLLVMFVALEVLSLPLYLMCGLARRRRLLSQEAAVKYFLLGAFASAFFLYGVAMLYGYANTINLAGIADAVRGTGRSDTLLLLGIGLLLVGLLFKAGVAPFHQWTPDVYQGAPTPVTALMASITKVAAFGAIIRILYVALPGMKWDWRPVLIAVAMISMVVGAVLAVTQTDVKRLLAYSSIANAGFLLTGVIALTPAGLSSTLFYLAAYGLTTVGAFAVVMLVRDADGEATHLSRWAGLGRRSPLFAAVFTFFLLAYAGIPLTSGFTSKFAVFSAAAGGGAMPLVIVGVVASAVIAFPYLRVIVLMFLSPPADDTPTVTVPGAFTAAALTVGVLGTLLLGVAPSVFLDLAESAATLVAAR